MVTKQVKVINKNTGRTVVYSSARAASKALSGTGKSGSEKTITKRCKEGGGIFKNSRVSWIK